MSLFSMDEPNNKDISDLVIKLDLIKYEIQKNNISHDHIITKEDIINLKIELETDPFYSKMEVKN